MDDDGFITLRASDSRIEISDTGPGIPDTDLPRVFDPNFTTKSQRGSGLGLAVVRDVMHRHGGSAQARRLPGGGTCIELRFRSIVPTI
jgi:signal transduction histidine kinase